jgi:hypothetical protein
MATMKRQVRNAATQDLEVARLESMRLWLEMLKKRPDFAEGIASFVEKRPPEFAPGQAERAFNRLCGFDAVDFTPDMVRIRATFRPGLSAHEKIFHGGRQAARRGDAHGEHLRQQDRRPGRRGGQTSSPARNGRE